MAQEPGFSLVVVEEVLASSSEGEDLESDQHLDSKYPFYLPVALHNDYLLLRRSPNLPTGPSTYPRPVHSSLTRE